MTRFFLLAWFCAFSFWQRAWCEMAEDGHETAAITQEDIRKLKERVARLERHCGLSLATASSYEESDDYNRALTLLKQGDYQKAGVAFRHFCALYPHSSFLALASYWLGVTFFVRGEYDEAVKAFDICLTKWPESDKALDTRLKVALCYQRLDQTEKAQKALASFRQALEANTSLDAQARVRFGEQADALERTLHTEEPQAEEPVRAVSSHDHDAVPTVPLHHEKQTPQAGDAQKRAI
ncbi:tol-pal system protein YbgF [bacterium NHP-B]|nr:tol-pal system protein YbgF [bacterium NHP-B]